MGYPDDEEQQQFSPQTEETRPLYRKSQEYHESTPELPDPKASPDEVRNFLVQIMRQRGVSIDHARRIASRWTLGTGRELRSYPVAIYGDIFGPEDGWAVCKEIKVLVYKEQKVKDASERWLPLFLLVVAAAVFGGSIAILDHSTHLWWLLLAIIGASVGFLAIVVLIGALLPGKDPESKAEDELKRGWHKTTPSS